MHETMLQPVPEATALPVDVSELNRREIKQLVAPTLAALSRVNLNARPYRLARWLVECTLARGVNFLFAPRLEFIAGPLGFTKTEVHEILHGYSSLGRPVAGLVEIGFVRVRECALDKGWLLVIIPDASRWDVAAVYSAADHAKRLADVDSVRLAFARQLESREIAEWFPDLDAVLDEVSLENALLASRQGPSEALPVAMRGCESSDAHEISGATDHGVAASRVSSTLQDAHAVQNGTQPRAVRRGRSEIQNRARCENTGKSGDVLKFRTPVKQLNSLQQKTVQPLNSAKCSDDSNRLLAELEKQFARVEGAQAARSEMVNSGGNWRNIALSWPMEFEVQVGELRNFLDAGGKVKTRAWFYFQFYFARSVGAANWKVVSTAAKKWEPYF